MTKTSNWSQRLREESKYWSLASPPSVSKVIFDIVRIQESISRNNWLLKMFGTVVLTLTQWFKISKWPHLLPCLQFNIRIVLLSSLRSRKHQARSNLTSKRAIFKIFFHYQWDRVFQWKRFGSSNRLSTKLKTNAHVLKNELTQWKKIEKESNWFV